MIKYFCIKCEKALDIIEFGKVNRKKPPIFISEKVSKNQQFGSIDGGNWVTDYGGYGSRYDLNLIHFAICDDCIISSSENGLVFMYSEHENFNILSNRSYTLKLMELQNGADKNK